MLRVFYLTLLCLLVCSSYASIDTAWVRSQLLQYDTLSASNPGDAEKIMLELQKLEEQIEPYKDLHAHYLFNLGEFKKVHGHYREADSVLQLSASLYHQINKDRSAIRVKKLQGDVNMYWGKYDRALEFIDEVVLYKKKHLPEDNLLAELGRYAAIHLEAGERAKATRDYKKLFARADSLGLSHTIFMDYANYGVLLMNMGKYQDALQMQYKALHLCDSAQKLLGKATIVKNISILHKNLGNYDEAEEYMRSSLEIARKAKANAYIAEALIANGLYEQDFGRFESSIPFFEEALSLIDSTDQKEDYAKCLIYSSWSYFETGRKEMAYQYARLGLQMRRELKSLYGIAEATDYIGYYYMLDGDLETAAKFYEEGIAIAKKNGYLAPLTNLYNEKQTLLIMQKDFEGAYYTLKEYYTFRDSVVNSARARETRELEAIYQNEKKQLEIDNLAQQNQLKDTEINLQKSEAGRQRQRTYFLFGGLSLAILFGIFIFNRFRVTNKQKNIIQLQKQRVDQAYEQLEEKNSEILDSINYARRLQSAILPPKKLVKEWLPESFILYKPKDIVAGDFYWMETIDDIIYFAAADCTGHGVPGAMVSVVCSNALSKALLEEDITRPSEILNRTRELVIDRFSKSEEEEVKDGMDISLCALNTNTNQLQWAGANNPIWIIRKDNDKVEEVMQGLPHSSKAEKMDDYTFIEIKADKQPIGKYAGQQPFTNHVVQLRTGDSLYIFSDGYPDQFGGEKGKKYKTAKFKRYLVEIASQDMTRQMTMLDREFESWRGEIEQIDDVCIIGVRV